MSGRRRSAGFTLVEMLVALTIFGMLAAASVTLLAFSMRAQAEAGRQLDRVAELRRAGALLTGDLAQAAPRLTRDAAGSVRPAFFGEPGGGDGMVLALARRGWSNHDAAPRASLQRVEYHLAAGRLERRGAEFLDGAPADRILVAAAGVTDLRLRYRDDKGAWRDRWDPEDITRLPRAVEMTAVIAGLGTVRQAFLVETAP